ncbi:fluoride efflux transporter CrcB [Kribbella pittospori]|uniref:Fluoride-specific ion channel FluC n=1 Tax=Kribbella pittospori TaxID=722689 RepID=A0A4R0L2P4_9ACTN|nr:fluoride efflux transporter CrcB [Kribbella pittospori]TCC62905.1 fluoride efflux transporter CrcB [Kribbella pittospori]
MQHERTDPAPWEPVDPDVDLRHDRPVRRTGDTAVLAVIAAGGAIGAVARYLVGQAWPTPIGSFPWATLIINVVGCGLIGILMVVVSEVLTRQRLIRPFLGTGVLGGFTTFSTYTLDIQQLIANRHPGTALLYLAATVAGALIAVWATVTATRTLVAR